MKDSYSYSVTTGPVRDEVVHGRRKRRDHAEAMARRLSEKYDDAFRVWETREYDSYLGRIASTSEVATYRNGSAVPRG